MKLQIISLALIGIFSAPTFAGPGGTGGIGTVPTLRMNGELRSMANELRVHRYQIEALRTFKGDYARFEDLNEGFVHFRGASVIGNQIKLELNDQELEIESIILSDGRTITVKSIKKDKILSTNLRERYQNN